MDSQSITLHIGPLGDRPGGIAQVVQIYTSHATRSVMLSWDTVSSRKVWGVFRVIAELPGRLRRLRASVRPLLVAHVSQGGSFIREGGVLVAAKFLGIPAAIMIHGSSFPSWSSRHRRLVRIVLNSADCVFVLTPEAEHAVREAGVSVRTALIRNLVRLPLVTEEMRIPTVLFAGEIGTRKGVDVLLTAWRELETSGWTLNLAGPLSSDFHLTNCEGMSCLGPIPNAAVRDQMQTASIFVLPSRAEALPVAILEAMAAGAVVVSTSVGSIPELLDEGCGLVVPPGDPTALGVALLTLMRDEAMRAAMAQRARDKVAREYDAARHMASIEDQWEHCRDGGL